MSKRSGWFLPLALVAACLPCVLIPIVASLIAAGAFGGLLGFLGVPWALALWVAVPLGFTLIIVRRHRKAIACSIPPPHTSKARIGDGLRGDP